MQEMQQTQVQSLSWEDPLEKEMATHASILAWKTPRTEEPGGYSPRGRKELDTSERAHTHTHRYSHTHTHTQTHTLTHTHTHTHRHTHTHTHTHSQLYEEGGRDPRTGQLFETTLWFTFPALSLTGWCDVWQVIIEAF